MENFHKLLKYAEGMHNRVIKRERLEMVALYYGGILANACNYRLYNQNTDELEILNFYGLLFIKSGGGKDHAKNVMGKPFEPILKNMPGSIEYLATTSSSNEHDNVLIPQQYKKKAPKDYELNIGSSDIGLYIAGLFINNAGIGSLNISINEFGDHVDNTKNINLLKEMYDGTIMAKMIQGEKDDEVRQNIYHMPSNLIAYGTPIGIKKDKKKLDSFKSITQSGIYRRSYIYYELPMRSEKKDIEIIDVSDLQDAYMNMVLEKGIKINGNKQTVRPVHVLQLNSEAQAAINAFEDELLDNANDHLYDELIPLDETAYKTVERAAALIAILDLSEEVRLDHTEYAIELFKRTRESITSLFEQTPVFETIYLRLVTAHEPMMKSDIIKKLGITVKEFDDSIDMVNELAHRYNKRLKTVGNSIKRFSIEDYVVNDLQKMIISVSSNFSTKPERAVDFQTHEVPFFDGVMSIRTLVTSEEVQSFCLSHFEPSAQAPNGHRKKDNFIPGQNMVAWDIDDGLSIEECQAKLKQYSYIIYTTRNHQKEKNNKVRDRFRVIMPTKTEYHVSVEQHKVMYENLSKVLDLPTYDVSTRNVSRLWFTNPDAIVIENRAEPLDVRCCLEETETAEKLLPAITHIDIDEQDKRLAGMMKWIVANTVVGDRNTKLYQFGKFMVDIAVPKHDIDYKMHYVNSMIYEPLPETEVNTIISNL